MGKKGGYGVMSLNGDAIARAYPGDNVIEIRELDGST
jgi:hypothetical protein